MELGESVAGLEGRHGFAHFYHGLVDEDILSLKETEKKDVTSKRAKKERKRKQKEEGKPLPHGK